MQNLLSYLCMQANLIIFFSLKTSSMFNCAHNKIVANAAIGRVGKLDADFQQYPFV